MPTAARVNHPLDEASCGQSYKCSLRIFLHTKAPDLGAHLCSSFEPVSSSNPVQRPTYPISIGKIRFLSEVKNEQV